MGRANTTFLNCITFFKEAFFTVSMKYIYIYENMNVRVLSLGMDVAPMERCLSFHSLAHWLLTL